ncbi:acetate/propionate family kinase [Azohydromonas aeria]|uniref:acetate/propionate family kinase n=1 Tax=Azohydromonas aeria TaxID=2590212 RepID=UPI0012FBF1B2|nr:acetate/propionate family kinase [Azohydromonas aeria]
MGILSVNAGSSTLKFAVYPLQGGEVQPALLSGSFEGLEPQGQMRLSWSAGAQRQQRELAAGSDPFAQALVSLSELLETEGKALRIEAVAHRVVHGGAHFRDSVVVDEAVLRKLEPLCPLAPLHQPANLAGIRNFMRVLPGLPQVACFDTAFHAGLPEVEYSFALPKSLRDEGVRRYGFHGLSYQFVSGQLQQLAGAPARGRLLMAHLGNGASLCAAREGRSIGTTMGFSAVEGLMMGSRCGALDPGVLLYLMEQGWTHDRIQALLYKQSGLLGVSGLTADMRRLRDSDSADAKFAIELFTHRVAREAGALTACLGGLDLLAFSGGIGEHDTRLRADVAERLAYLGVKLDAAANARATGNEALPIHAADSAVQVWVVPTDEGIVAARDAARLVTLPANG